MVMHARCPFWVTIIDCIVPDLGGRTPAGQPNADQCDPKYGEHRSQSVIARRSRVGEISYSCRSPSSWTPAVFVCARLPYAHNPPKRNLFANSCNQDIARDKASEGSHTRPTYRKRPCEARTVRRGGNPLNNKNEVGFKRSEYKPHTTLQSIPNGTRTNRPSEISRASESYIAAFQPMENNPPKSRLYGGRRRISA